MWETATLLSSDKIKPVISREQIVCLSAAESHSSWHLCVFSLNGSNRVSFRIYHNMHLMVGRLGEDHEGLCVAIDFFVIFPCQIAFRDWMALRHVAVLRLIQNSCLVSELNPGMMPSPHQPTQPLWCICLPPHVIFYSLAEWKGEIVLFDVSFFSVPLLSILWLFPFSASVKFSSQC